MHNGVGGKKKPDLIFWYFGLVGKGQTNIFFLGLSLEERKENKT